MVRQAGKEALVLLLVSVALAAAVFGVRPEAYRPPSSAQKSGTDSRPVPVGVVPEISLGEAFQHFEKGSALFADARQRPDYDAGHIQGAVNLYLADQAEWLAAFQDSTDPKTTIICYCDGEACHLAPELAAFLFFSGFDQVYYLKNGWSLWKEAGYPVEEKKLQNEKN